MKLLAWNLNHRAARHRIADWIACAIVAHSPDVVVLTEYVEGHDHERFLGALADGGLRHALLSPRVERQNQVLIVSNQTLRRGVLQAPPIDPAVPPNALETVLEASGLHVIGFRMPAFSGAERPLKRETWDWLLGESDRLHGRAAVIVGDFNTAPNDSMSLCGDCFAKLSQSGWQCGTPMAGCSWRHASSGAERQIDHVFLSPALSLIRSEYCWQFERLAPDAASKKVGVPDHAMLLAEITLPEDAADANGEIRPAS